MRTAIITVNTAGYEAKIQSEAGKAVQTVTDKAGLQTIVNATLPEDKKILTTFLNRLIDDKLADLILTIGSTGVKPTDVMPETTEEIVDRVLPGINEAIRANNIKISPASMMDRSTSGIRKGTLVVNLPEASEMAQKGLEAVLSGLVNIVEEMK